MAVDVVLSFVGQQKGILQSFLKFKVVFILHFLLINQTCVKVVVHLLTNDFGVRVILHFQIKFLYKSKVGKLHDKRMLV